MKGFVLPARPRGEPVWVDSVLAACDGVHAGQIHEADAPSAVDQARHRAGRLSRAWLPDAALSVL
jgi:hypothetical protein